MADLSRFAINQITTRDWTMAEAIEGYAAQGVGGIAAWVGHMDAYGVDRTARHIRDAGLWVASLCTGAWMNADSREGFLASLDENRRRLDAAATIGAPCVVMVVGGVRSDKDIADQRERVREGLHALAPHAEAVGVKLGLEPLHPMYAGDRSVLNRIKDANDLIDELGDKAAGLVPDVYHCWWDPDFEPELRRAGKDRILTFHYCDWLVPTRTLCDRGMVGDGVVDIPRVRGWLDDIGYENCFELELFSELDWWKRPGAETVRVGIERCAPFVGALKEKVA